MPPKKTGEPKEVEGQCILQLGRSNNIIQWTEDMKTSISLLYGVAGNFFMTNVRHEYPIPREEDYLPVLPAPEEGQPAIPPLPAALVTKLREFCIRKTQQADCSANRKRAEDIPNDVGKMLTENSRGSGFRGRVPGPGPGPTMGVHTTNPFNSYFRGWRPHDRGEYP
jgi:hypothetical protein